MVKESSPEFRGRVIEKTGLEQQKISVNDVKFEKIMNVYSSKYAAFVKEIRWTRREILINIVML